MATRWAMVGAGKICHDFITSVRSMPKVQAEHHFVAVANKPIGDAEKFAKLHKISNFYGSYEDVSKNPDIDIVYVGVINPFHFEVTKEMLEAGKNVLVEKPFAMNHSQTKYLIELAKERRAFLMEGMWNRFMPSYVMLSEEISSGKLGEIRYVHANFGNILTSPRILEKALGGGATLDIGIYCINAVLCAFGYERPEKITAVGNLNQDGIDVETSAVLQFSRGRMATFSTSVEVKYNCELDVVGTKGKLKLLNPFWCATTLMSNDKMYDFPLANTDCNAFNFINAAGLYHEAVEVRRCLQQGLLECPRMPLVATEISSYIMDEIRKQIGVVYPADEQMLFKQF